MRPPSLLRTVSFRLAALYVVIFGLSVVALAAVVYVITTTALDAQTRARITSESQELANDYNSGGLDKLVAAVRARELGRLAGGLEYTIYYGAKGRVYGDLPRPPRSAGWSTVAGPPDGDEAPGKQEQLIVYAAPLKPGAWLMVGDDLGKVNAVGALIMTAFGYALLAMITLAVAGGIALSAAFLRRIDSITRSAEAIIEGNIQQRMPLRGTGDDIDRLSATLNRMLDRIAGLMESLNQVSSDIAHDLRTPLSRMRHTLDEARRSAKDTQQYEAAVDRALGETDSLLDTFAAILRIAQIESGSRRAGFRPLNFSALCLSIAQTYAPVAEDESASLKIDIASGLTMQGDRELLMQLLANLIENAIRHAGAGAVIAVTLSGTRDGVMLRVADNGPGIPEHERQAVLRRFYRLERSRTTPGSGLGFTLIAAIAELHGAVLTLGDNAPGLSVNVLFAAMAKSEAAGERAGAPLRALEA